LRRFAGVGSDRGIHFQNLPFRPHHERAGRNPSVSYVARALVPARVAAPRRSDTLGRR
jgi:hypothetical protein